MSIQSEYADRTAERTTPNAPDTYELAAQLGVDAALLREFVRHHPAPTAAIVLGWVHREGGDADPSVYAEEVDRWLVAFENRNRTDTEAVDLDAVFESDGIGAERWGR